MEHLSGEFCTCKNLKCPLHPTKHDKGCAPCIAKNLKVQGIPNCFFNTVKGAENRTGDKYIDFAQVVIKSNTISSVDRNVKAAISTLQRPEDIMSFFDGFFDYGCIDVDGVRHIDSLGGDDFREKYRTLSLDASLENRIGACFEQTNITKYLLDKMGIKSKTLCTRGYNKEHKAPDDLYLVHCYTIAFFENEVLCVEHSDNEKRGIYRYASEEKAVRELHRMFSDKFKAHGAVETSVVEYKELIPGGMSFEEFNQWMNGISFPISY